MPGEREVARRYRKAEKEGVGGVDSTFRIGSLDTKAFGDFNKEGRVESGFICLPIFLGYTLD